MPIELSLWRSRDARTASSGFMCIRYMNHRGSYAPIGSRLTRGAPYFSQTPRRCRAYALSPAKYILPFGESIRNAPHNVLFVSQIPLPDVWMESRKDTSAC